MVTNHLPSTISGVFYRMFRPEFLKNGIKVYQLKKLSSDTCSGWGATQSKAHESNLRTATKCLCNDVVTGVAGMIAELARKFDITRVPLGSDDPTTLHFPDTLDICSIFHQSGLPIRHTVLVLRSLQSSWKRSDSKQEQKQPSHSLKKNVSVIIRSRIISEMVERGLKHQLKNMLRMSNIKNLAQILEQFRRYISQDYQKDDELFWISVCNDIALNFGFAAVGGTKCYFLSDDLESLQSFHHYIDPKLSENQLKQWKKECKGFTLEKGNYMVKLENFRFEETSLSATRQMLRYLSWTSTFTKFCNRPCFLWSDAMKRAGPTSATVSPMHAQNFARRHKLRIMLQIQSAVGVISKFEGPYNFYERDEKRSDSKICVPKPRFYPRVKHMDIMSWATTYVSAKKAQKYLMQIEQDEKTIRRKGREIVESEDETWEKTQIALNSSLESVRRLRRSGGASNKSLKVVLALEILSAFTSPPWSSKKEDPRRHDFTYRLSLAIHDCFNIVADDEKHGIQDDFENCTIYECRKVIETAWKLTLSLSKSFIFPGFVYLKEIPDWLCKSSYGVSLNSLRKLMFKGHTIAELPSSCIPLWENLSDLNISFNKLQSVPDNIGNLKYLESLDLRNNSITFLPSSLCKPKWLKVLDLQNNNLMSLPIDIGSLVSLQILNLHYNHLKLLPDSVCSLQNLRYLDVAFNSLVSLPVNVGKLKELLHLDFSRNRVWMLPSSLGHLKRLEYLDFSFNTISSIPEALTYLSSLKHLYAERNKLSSLPLTWSAMKSLEHLKLGHNKLRYLPPSFGNLGALVKLSIECNAVSQVPLSIVNLPKLEVLELSYNGSNCLPSESIPKFKSLRQLSSYGNEIMASSVLRLQEDRKISKELAIEVRKHSFRKFFSVSMQQREGYEFGRHSALAVLSAVFCFLILYLWTLVETIRILLHSPVLVLMFVLAVAWYLFILPMTVRH
mmetsp:Transcript_649/g.952  ORF Transcript_649/g.952 Transcript_649/m.952 type:complete len:956 (-) Transcript_649:293-3160(-)